MCSPVICGESHVGLFQDPGWFNGSPNETSSTFIRRQIQKPFSGFGNIFSNRNLTFCWTSLYINNLNTKYMYFLKVINDYRTKQIYNYIYISNNWNIYCTSFFLTTCFLENLVQIKHNPIIIYTIASLLKFEHEKSFHDKIY